MLRLATSAVVNRVFADQTRCRFDCQPRCTASHIPRNCAPALDRRSSQRRSCAAFGVATAGSLCRQCSRSASIPTAHCHRQSGRADRARNGAERPRSIATIKFAYVTHSQSKAFAIAGRVVIMGHAGITQICKPQEICREPRTRFVAEVMDRNNTLPDVA